MKTRPVGDAQYTKQYVYNIPCHCGRCYIGETSRPSEVRTKEHKYNLTQGLDFYSDSTLILTTIAVK
jgi:predicted GIY-YIG superfamily endonuclease